MKKLVVIFLLSIVAIVGNGQNINFSMAIIGKLHQSQLTIPMVGLQIGLEYKKERFASLLFIEGDFGWSLKEDYGRSESTQAFLAGDKLSYAIGAPVYSLDGTYSKTFWIAPSLELGYTNENLHKKIAGEEDSQTTVNYFYLTPGVDFNLIIAKKLRLVIAVGEGILFSGNTSGFKGIYSKIGNVEYCPEFLITFKY